MENKRKLSKILYFVFLLTIITITLVSGPNTKYKLDINDELDSSKAKKWVMFDISDINIKFNLDEMPELFEGEDNVLIGVEKTENNKTDESDSKERMNKNDIWNNNLLLDINKEKEKNKGNYLNYLEITKEDEKKSYFENEQQNLKIILPNKNLSILGDSISTFNNYSNKNGSQITNSSIVNNIAEYPAAKYDVTNVNQTWWMQIANETGMNLLVNNSNAGDKVAYGGQIRSAQLHDDTGENQGTKPDIIVVYYGINDIKAGATFEDFEMNYSNMLSIINNNYPEAEIFLLTHVPYKWGTGKRKIITNEEIENFNEIIRKLSFTTHNCHLVDYYKESGIRDDNYEMYTADNLHPNLIGMDLITKSVEKSLLSYYLK